MILHRFELPVRPVLVTRKIARSAGQVILADAEERLWVISCDSRSLQECPRMISGKLPLGSDGQVTEYCDVVDDRILLSCERDKKPWHEVWSLLTGERLFSVLETGGAVLVPSGRYLLLLDESHIDVVDLQKPTAKARRTALVLSESRPKEENSETNHGPDLQLDSPSTAMTVTSSNNADMFTLAMGDYGFAVVVDMKIDEREDPGLRLLGTPHILSEGLVYDPVDIVDLTPGQSLVVRHGCGCGLTRFDLQTGRPIDCPNPTIKPEPRYGVFRQVVVSTESEELWVRTDVGPYYWCKNGQLHECREADIELLATNGEHYIGLSPDGLHLISGVWNGRKF